MHFNVGSVYKQGLENDVSTSQILARLSRLEARLDALTRDVETRPSNPILLSRNQQASKLEMNADPYLRWSTRDAILRHASDEHVTGNTPMFIRNEF
jgi:hypothetical protein